MDKNIYVKPEVEVIEYMTEGVMANTTVAIDNSGENPNISRSKRRSFWNNEE